MFNDINRKKIFTLVLIVLTAAYGKNLPTTIRISNRVDFDEIITTTQKLISTETTAAPTTTTITTVAPTLVQNKISDEKVLTFLADYRKLRTKNSDVAMRILGTVGLVSGALKVEEAMRENLYRLADDWYASFNTSTPKQNVDKLLLIEETIDRDKASIDVLISILEFARHVKTFEAFQKDMQRILKENEASAAKLRNKKQSLTSDMVDERKSISTGKLMQRSEKSMKYEMTEKLNEVRKMIDRHVNDIHSRVTENAKRTIEYVQSLQKSNEKLLTPKSTFSKRKSTKLDASLDGLQRLWDQVASKNSSDSPSDFSVSVNLPPNGSKSQKSTLVMSSEQSGESNRRMFKVQPKMDRFRRQDVTKLGKGSSKKSKREFAIEIELGDEFEAESKQDDEENEIDGEKKSQESEPQSAGDGDEFDESSGSESEEAGGLVGLISNLSGGEEGSDVGAIIGAVTQVLTNLLGPGGLDIPSVISSATALLSSLLAGDENFGKVLGNYVGLAIDGFSGGGGAANNGQYFGQFLGKFITILSADPEDEDLPPKPDIFIENFFDGIQKGAAKKVDGDESGKDGGKPTGSDSGSFLTHVFTTIFAGIASGLANASVGSSGGSSQTSAGLSGGSSHGSSSQSHKT